MINKAARLREETGNPNIFAELERERRGTPGHLWRVSLLRPFRFLFTEPVRRRNLPLCPKSRVSDASALFADHLPLRFDQRSNFRDHLPRKRSFSPGSFVHPTRCSKTSLTPPLSPSSARCSEPEMEVTDGHTLEPSTLHTSPSFWEPSCSSRRASFRTLRSLVSTDAVSFFSPFQWIRSSAPPREILPQQGRRGRRKVQS